MGERTPLLAEVARDLRQRHRVQDPVGRDTALAGHLDAPMHVVELRNRVRVRIDAQHAAELKRRLMPAPIQVETPWVGVDLHDDIMLCACPKHLLDAIQQAARVHPGKRVLEDITFKPVNYRRLILATDLFSQILKKNLDPASRRIGVGSPSACRRIPSVPGCLLA